MNRFRHLGIQKRIMLYVTLGLAAMFGSFAFVGLRSIQEATELVYDQRPSVAYTTAGMLSRDFLHVARNVVEASPALLSLDEPPLEAAAQELLDHLFNTDLFPFFRVTGLAVLDTSGHILAEAGWPALNWRGGFAALKAQARELRHGEFTVLPAGDAPAGGVPFATIATRLGDPVDPPGRLVVVHTVSASSSAPYIPPRTGVANRNRPARPRPWTVRRRGTTWRSSTPRGWPRSASARTRHPVNRAAISR